jgi:hypothetical protein
VNVELGAQRQRKEGKRYLTGKPLSEKDVITSKIIPLTGTRDQVYDAFMDGLIN